MSSLRMWVFVAVAVLVAAGPAAAATITFGLDVEFSGADAPEGTAPWATATFDDSFGGANTVRLTMSANNLVDSETVKDWLFNFDPNLNPNQITFTPVNNSASVPDNILTGTDLFKADGDGFYDILFDFPPPPGSQDARFEAGETVIYDLTYVAPISAFSFNFLSEPDGGQGEYFSAAQIQQIGPDDTGSGWIGFVPEPSTGLLVAAGLAALAASRRKGLT